MRSEIEQDEIESLLAEPTGQIGHPLFVALGDGALGVPGDEDDALATDLIQPTIAASQVRMLDCANALPRLDGGAFPCQRSQESDAGDERTPRQGAHQKDPIAAIRSTIASR